MLELAREVKPRLFLQFSTDESFGVAPEGFNHTEWSPHIPSNPYAASKAAQEDIAISYWRTYGVPVVITNTMNIFSETQDWEKYIPLCVNKILNNEEITIHSYPGATKAGSRFYIHANSVAENVLKWGTGGINIDGSRVGMSQSDKEMLDAKASTNNNGVNFDVGESKAKGTATPANNLGRFPANLIHDGSEQVLGLFPDSKSSNAIRKNNGKNDDKIFGKYAAIDSYGFDDSGSAVRFFYCAKTSKSERNKGCEELEEKEVGNGENGSSYKKVDINGSGNLTNSTGKVAGRKNNHPTVKPQALMKYLIKLITPPGGIVLDPFAGSGSTLVAAKDLGHNYIGIEMTEEYIPIINARLNN